MQYNGTATFTEDAIERAVKRMTDRLDRRYLSSRMTTKEYNDENSAIADWAREQYRKVQK